MNRHETKFDTLIANLLGADFPRCTDLTGVDRDNIVLDRYLRVSDLVVMHMDKEARGWGAKGVPDGTVGIVVGFHRYETYRARINNFGRAPGKYACSGVAMVRWSDGSVSSPGASDLRWLFDHDKKQQERRNDRLYNEVFEYEARVGDLPDLPFWEMDIVKFRPKNGRQPWKHTTRGRIENIDYHNLDAKRQDGSPMPIYSCTPLERGHGRVSFEELELQLVARGNLWMWFNGQRDQVKFDSLEDEIAFHVALGNKEQVRCEQTQGYNWPFSAILPALQAGTIDCIKRSAGMFGASDSHSAYKLTDPDLSRRVREESIKGYTQDAKLRVVGDEWDEFTSSHIIRRAIEFNLPFVNVKHSGGYVDTTQLELLNIPVVKHDPVESPWQCPSGSYIFFSPRTGAFDLPHTSTYEVDTAAQKLARAFKRNRDDSLMVRVQSSEGWNEKNREVVIAACKAFGVPFADRAAVADDVMRQSGIEHIVVTEDSDCRTITFEIDGYVFFTHRNMKDLPYDVTINLNKDTK